MTTAEGKGEMVSRTRARASARATTAGLATAAIALAAAVLTPACGGGSGATLPAGSAICVGVATACGQLAGVACGRAQGCVPGICSGTAAACAVLTSPSSCAIQEGCSWNAATATCGGTAEAGSRFGSSATCVGQAGCTWAAGCAGWPAECSSLSVSACGAQPGCSVQVIDGGATPDVGATPDATPAYCSGAIAPNADELIDDMEDGNASIGPRPGWNGTWYVFHDGTTAGHMVPGDTDPITMESIVGGRCGSTLAMRISGNGFTDWGAGTGFSFSWGGSAALPVDFSRYDGIAFWARTGQGTTSRFRVNLLDKDTEPQGGYCDATSTAVGEQCYDHWGVFLTDVGNDWKQYQVKFSDLAQRGFGRPTDKFDPSTLYGIEFQIDPSSLFDVWLDDIAFTNP